MRSYFLCTNWQTRWKPECVLSFNMDWRILVFYPGSEARDTIYPPSFALLTCAGECDWLFHWQHKLCAIFSANVNINYRLPIQVYYRICTLRHMRSYFLCTNWQTRWKPECVLSFNMDWRILVFYPGSEARDTIY
jgi:hypothetical protein